MELEGRLATAGEKFRVAAAEKIERGIEGRIRQSFEDAARDQAIPGAVNHRHGTGLRISGPIDRMIAKRGLHVGGKDRKHRAADDIGIAAPRRVDHLIQPNRRGHFVVVDHQEILRRRKRNARHSKGGVNGVDVPLSIFGRHEPLQSPIVEEGARDPEAFLGLRVIINHHDGEGDARLLRDERLQRRPQHFWAAKCRNANHGLGFCYIGRKRGH